MYTLLSHLPRIIIAITQIGIMFMMKTYPPHVLTIYKNAKAATTESFIEPELAAFR